MGLGYRDWVVGETITEPNFQGYIQDQTVMCFDTTAARDAAITSPVKGMVAVDNSTGAVYQYDSGIPAWVQVWRYWEWADYTPTWKGSVSDATIGNGTAQGRYLRMGRLIRMYAEIVIGSTTTAANGIYSLTLPVAPRTTNSQFLEARITDASTGNAYPGQAGPLDGSGALLRVMDTTGTYAVMVDAASAVPMAYATGDRLRMWGTYEASVST